MCVCGGGGVVDVAMSQTHLRLRSSVRVCEGGGGG